jgi:hypothetical protein
MKSSNTTGCFRHECYWRSHLVWGFSPCVWLEKGTSTRSQVRRYRESVFPYRAGGAVLAWRQYTLCNDDSFRNNVYRVGPNFSITTAFQHQRQKMQTALHKCVYNILLYLVKCV